MAWAGPLQARAPWPTLAAWKPTTLLCCIGSRRPLQPPFLSLSTSRGVGSWVGLACCASGRRALPQTADAVADWAEAAWRQACRTPSGEINLAKACLLLALEEEAAAQEHYWESEGVLGGAERGNAGSAATWNLERLDALAAEVTARFYAACSELGVTDSVEAASAEAADSVLMTLHMDLVRRYPVQLLGAVNDVLFERHGYQRMRRHGNAADSLLSSVLERGSGSPGTLAVLYLEVCARVGLALHAAPLDEGRYFVLWPAEEAARLVVGGEEIVVDPYSQGDLVSKDEVCELFGVEELAPASNTQILACILAVLKDSHWCRAVGCPPEPAFAVPISVDVALQQYNDVEITYSSEDSGYASEEEWLQLMGLQPREGGSSGGGGGAASSSGSGAQQQQWWPQEGHNLWRALATARKRAWLLPHDLRAQLEHALLLFFSRQYEDAWQELGCVLAAVPAADAPHEDFLPQEVERLQLLWEKLRLLVEFDC